jgi:hypothetical protein
MTKASKRVTKRIIKRLKEIFDIHTCLQQDENANYCGEIYADYRDEFDDSAIKKIFQADDARAKFYELLDFFDCECEYFSDLFKIIKKHFDDEDETLDFDEHEDFIREWVYENVYFKLPYDHYLGQDVYVDVIVDAGDANYDFTQNELFGCNISEPGLEGREQSSLVWLMKQQGYDMKAITEFVENRNMQGSKLFESIYQECINTTTCINALAFFVKLPLGEALDLHEIVTGSEKTSGEQNVTEIILDKGTPCGLYNAWSGAGSVLDIDLEKDVVLPITHIDSAMPDGCRGYSISSIYGMLRSFWADGGVRICASSQAA